MSLSNSLALGLAAARAFSRSFTTDAVPSTRQVIERELKYGARTYQVLPVALKRGEGVYVWDMEGKRYYDCLSGYSALNQGHLHPRIVNALKDQLTKLTLTSRAFHSDLLGEYMEYATKLFGYNRLLPMNSGVEAAETAVKLARRWGYDVKGIPPNEAKIVVIENNFWGRSIAAITSSSDPDSFGGFGPFLPGFVKIPYNNTAEVEVRYCTPSILKYKSIHNHLQCIHTHDRYTLLNCYS